MQRPLMSTAPDDAFAETCAPAATTAEDDLAGLRGAYRTPFMPSLMRPPGAPAATTTADVVDLLAQLRAVVGLGVPVEELGGAVVDGRLGA